MRIGMRILERRVTRRSWLAVAASLITAACGSSKAASPTTSAPSATATPAGAAAVSPTANSQRLNAGPTEAPAATPTVVVQGPPKLNYVSGSTTKVEQLIGDFDKQTQKPTTNLTQTRFGVIGTDLGNSFEHNGKVYFLFGDTIGPGARDPMGISSSTDPSAALALEFLSGKTGDFTPVKAPGVSMGPFEVPTAGISLNAVPYVSVITNYTPDKNTYKAVLLKFDDASGSFTSVRQLSQLPDGHFIKMTLREAPASLAGLPTAEPYVLMFGCDHYRASNAYLAAIPSASFTTGDGTRYFTGLKGNEPQWSPNEADCQPIVKHPTIGDLSVVYLEKPGVWADDLRQPRSARHRDALQRDALGPVERSTDHLRCAARQGLRRLHPRTTPQAGRWPRWSRHRKQRPVAGRWRCLCPLHHRALLPGAG